MPNDFLSMTNMSNSRINIDSILQLVEKPARYIGGEAGSVRKKDREGLVRFALCFPEIYEIGMSHHGGQILYDLVNSFEDFACERCFCPWQDMVDIMRERSIPLFSLESHMPLREFPIIGFSLEYELSYTNIFQMLDMAGIPLYSEQRKEDDPIVIAGGPCAYNPEPLAEVFDIIVIGDGEEILPKILNCFKDPDLSREEIIEKASLFEGVYAPRYYKPIYRNNRFIDFEIEGDHKMPIRAAKIENLPKKNYKSTPILPWMSTVHDRVSMEIMRGCGRNCRFCSAGWIYKPVRERKIDDLICEAEEYLEKTGWEELGLLSLSATDYSQLSVLLSRLSPVADKLHASISVPSIRPEGLDDNALGILSKERRSSMTFAPEAATERLRNVISKSCDDELLFDTISRIYKSGWKTVKLYFMIGLPTETMDDIQAIADYIWRVDRIRRANRGKLNVSISPFVPKGHSPFAWEKQDSIDEMSEKIAFLREQINSRWIHLSCRDPRLSHLEAILSRGDRRIGKIIEMAWRKGGGFDAWKESLDFEAWNEAIAELEIAPEIFTGEQPTEHLAPWEIVSSGVPREYLLAERKRAHDEKRSPDCYEKGGCENCGICDFSSSSIHKNTRTGSVSTDVNYGRRMKKTGRTPVRRTQTIRIRYAKEQVSKYVGHLDTIKAINRAIRRSSIQIAYSEGYHKHQKLSFGPPLPMGYSSRSEFVDMITISGTPERIIDELAENLPEGLTILDYQGLLDTRRSLFQLIDCAIYSVEIPISFMDDLPERFGELFSANEVLFARRRKEVDILKYLRRYHVEREEKNWHLTMELQCNSNGAGRPDEYLSALDMPREEVLNLDFCRRELLIQNEEEYFDPLGNCWGTWKSKIEGE